MTVIALDHLNLSAPRELLDTLKDFYCTVVGLEQGYRRPQSSFGYWLYAGGHPVLHLSEDEPHAPRPTELASTFNHVAFSCSDRGAAETRLHTLKVAFKTAIASDGQVQFFMQDPAGNGVELNFSV